MTTEHAELRRVATRIKDSIIEFCKMRDTFNGDELRDFVDKRVGPVAPASPDRVLRALRHSGEINYMVVSRRDSLYRVLS